MTNYFTGVKTIEELRKRYRELLRKYHPDNESGSTEITQQINAEYDRLFVILSKENKSDSQSYTYDENEENEAFKEVLNSIIHINADIEIIGSWLWVHGGYEYRDLLKSVGFKFAPKKSVGVGISENTNDTTKEISLDDIRTKYGCQNVNHKSKQYAIS